MVPCSDAVMSSATCKYQMENAWSSGFSGRTKVITLLFCSYRSFLGSDTVVLDV
jgi:hypothetical protein